ncbi:MAG TPA: DUF5615 family PIN-like protein [Gemmataceae bacterium]|nr:DUF5615 family PIN-like protein [Gemmataceae bacterium]
MRVLVDESVPRQLAPELRGHEVRTVAEVGWAGLKNGELLHRAAEAGFAGFITMDRNLQYQQSIGRLALGIVLLRAPNNRVETILPLAAAVLVVVGQLRPGTVVEVGA